MEDRAEQLWFQSDVDFLNRKIPFASSPSSALPPSHLVLGTYEHYRSWGEGKKGERGSERKEKGARGERGGGKEMR